MHQINIHSRAFLENPNAVLSVDGTRQSVAKGTSGPEFFTYDAVEALFRDDRIRPKTAEVYLDMGLSKDSPIYTFLQNGNFNMMPVPDHDRLRPLVLKGFRPKRIKDFTTDIAGITEGLILDLKDRGSCDVIADFSHHVSIRSIARFIGVPEEDVHAFEDATVELILLGTVPFMPGVPRLEAALVKIFAYIEGLIAKRRAAPREDFISDLMAHANGDDMTEAELVWSIVFILLAGHDTTRYQIAATTRAVIAAGAWERIAADPALIPKAVAETHRMYPAAYRFPRLVLEAFEHDGIAFRPNDLLSLNLAGAGRDPARFTDPDRFDLDRQGPAFGIGFGHGAHHCIGWALATAELAEALRSMTRHLVDPQIAGDIVYKVGGVIAGPESLKIRYTARG